MGHQPELEGLPDPYLPMLHMYKAKQGPGLSLDTYLFFHSNMEKVKNILLVNLLQSLLKEK